MEHEHVLGSLRRMATEEEYRERAKRLLRGEMVRRGVSYESLSERLGALGLPEPR